MENSLFHRLGLIVGIGFEIEAEISVLFTRVAEEKCFGQEREHLLGVGLIVFQCLLVFLEGGGIGDDRGEAASLCSRHDQG